MKYKGRRAGVALCQGINIVQVIGLLLDVALDKALGFLVWGFVLGGFLSSSAQNDSILQVKPQIHLFFFFFTQTSIFFPRITPVEQSLLH